MIMMQMTGTHLLLFKFALKLELFPPQDSISRIISPTGLNIKNYFPHRTQYQDFLLQKLFFFCHAMT